MDEKAFLEKFCITVHYGWETRISLTEKKNHDCIFWKTGEGCTVYAARPIQCKIYPVWPSVISDRQSWEDEAKKCPGMNKGPAFTDKEIRERLALRESNPFIGNH
jgi:Fe-S-cluster containining protein